jgi:hypothetical protein
LDNAGENKTFQEEANKDRELKVAFEFTALILHNKMVK